MSVDTAIFAILCAAVFCGLVALLLDLWDHRRPQIRTVPIADHILVLPIQRPLEVGGMARPQSSAEMPSEGVAVLVGPGRVTEHGVRLKPEVRPGDKISFPSYAGKTMVDPAGVPPGAYLLVRQDEVFLNHGPCPEEMEPHE